MKRSLEIVKSFRELFVQRDDCYALQGEDGAFRRISRPLSDEVILAHLKREVTIGLYPYSDSATKWVCIDIDTLEEAATRVVWEWLQAHRIPYLTEFSGRKGFHVWIFFDGKYSNRIARALANEIWDGEVFPVQDEIPKEGYGNLIKAPLGIHRVTGKWCSFVNDDFNEYDDQRAVLAGVKKINPTDIIQREFPDKWEELTQADEVDRPHTNEGNGFSPLPLLKDCVHLELRKGSPEGRRNPTGHIIATELRKAGFTQEQTHALLGKIWNPKNQPPLGGKEVNQIVRGVYAKESYDYGCKPDGRLRETIQCLGEETCAYYTILRNRRDE